MSHSQNTIIHSGLRTPTWINSRTHQRVVLLRDSSGSMSEDNKAAAAAAASADLLRELAAPANRDAFEVAVVDFAVSANPVAPFTPATGLGAHPPDLTAPGGGTNITAALRLSLDLLRRAQATAGGVHYLRPVILLFTDGGHNHGEAPEAVATELKQEADLVCIAFGPDADTELLSRIASSPQHVYRCANGGELRQFLASVGATLSQSLATGGTVLSGLQR